MKVYIKRWKEPNDTRGIIGVYSSREAAEKDPVKTMYDRVWIEEWELKG